MNKDSFLNCLAYTGVATGTSVVALYSFSSGTTGACFNQIYTSGYNYYSGLPYNGALPLVFNGTGKQTSGVFSRSQPYQVGSNYTGDFGALISLNYSGCQNTGNINFVLASTTSGLVNNSGVILGITPSNRLFLSVSGYNASISQEIQPYDFAFLSVEKNRFINFGVYNLKDSSFYRKVYDYGSSNLAVQNLYFGGALSYPVNFTGYSGNINEIYLFSGNVSDSFINPCINCIYATGYGYNSTSATFTGIQITGSYWSGIQEVQQTGVQKATSSYRRVDGSSGTIYYDSGLTGNVTVYQSLVAQTGGVPYTILDSGISFLFDTGKRYSQTLFNAYFDLGLSSGDVVEIYTYQTNNPNVNLNISNNSYPLSTQEVQVFGNGLAETKNVDYGVAFNNLITGFDTSDILMYDLYTGTTTIPYNTGYVSTGVSYVSGSVVIITGASGVSFSYPFQYDVYFNGQKMTTGIDYSVSGVAGNSRIISSSGSTSGYNLAFFDINQSNYLELKFLPIQSGSIKRVYSITGDSYYVTGILGFSEQVWKNGIRQKRGVDYFKEEPCRFFTGEYVDPNYSFQLFSTQNTTISPLFVTSLNSFVVDVSTGIDLRIANLSAAASMPIYSYSDVTNGVYVRNTGFWAKDIDLTAISPSKETSPGVYASDIGTTLISPRHLLGCAHAGAGSKRRFVTKDNVVIERTIIATLQHPSYVPYYPDIQIHLLDSDVPTGIGFLKVLPKDWRKVFQNRGITPLGKVPIFGSDQESKGIVYDWTINEIPSAGNVMISCGGVPPEAQRAAFSEQVVGGDSGFPICMIIGNEAVLLGSWTFGYGYEAGTDTSYQTDAINTMMSQLGGGYQLTAIDLSKYY